MKSPDQVCADAAKRGIRLSFTIKGKDVLIEGDRESLVFLADVIRAQAKFEKDCGFGLSPTGAGSIFFHGRRKGLGFYIHRVPCLEKQSSHLARPAAADHTR